MFRCKVCGWLHAGEVPPDTCPACGSPADRFRPVGSGLGDPTEPAGERVADQRLRLLALVPATIDSPFARRSGPRLDVVTGDAAWFDDNIPCMRACPVNTDVATYIGHVADGAFGLAAALNRDQNLFAGSLGRTCSRPCEDACRRTVIDDPIQIRALKRVATDHEPPPSTGEATLAGHPATGRRVAVIGAGVAGLTAARELRAAGHAVTVFERDERPGGLLVSGVPAWRLPREVAAADIAALVAQGIEIVTGRTLGADLALADLSRDHDAVVIATGAQAVVGLSLERACPTTAEPDPGVLDGLSFLAAVARGEQGLSGPVVVIGGGYTAFDCARTARRLGRGPVTIAMRQPGTAAALAEELAEAAAEGIAIRTGVTLDSITRDRAGAVVGVRLSDAAVITDEIPCAVIIAALGQEPDWSILHAAPASGQAGGRVFPDEVTGRLAEWPNVWLAGDVLSGSSSFIEAIASGKRTGQAIDRQLAVSGTVEPQTRVPAAPLELSPDSPASTDTGQLAPGDVPAWTVDSLRRRLSGNDPYRDTRRQETEVRPPSDRGLGSGDVSVEVDLGLTAEIAQREAARCLQCQANIFIDGDRCILCNGCVDVCPYGCIEMLTLDRLASIDGLAPDPATVHGLVAMVIDEDSCIRCGKCVDWCPTACLTMDAHRPTLGGVPHGFDIRSLVTG